MYLIFSHACGTALGMAVLNHFGPHWNISAAIGLIVMKFCTDIYDRLGHNRVTFPLVPPAGQTFFFCCGISQHSLNGLIPFCTDGNNFHIMYLNDCDGSLTFNLEPSWGGHLQFQVKCLNNSITNFP